MHNGTTSGIPIYINRYMPKKTVLIFGPDSMSLWELFLKSWRIPFTRYRVSIFVSRRKGVDKLQGGD